MTELEDDALSQFDQLVESGDLLYQDNIPRIVQFEPFKFEFRVAPSLKNKPQNEEEDNESDPSPAFQDKKSEFSLGLFGPNKKHKLILNKFCVVRPQFVLHTVEVEPQIDGLSADDFAAAQDVLQQIGKRYMIIFNCGKDGGASVEHKHVQVIPKAEHIDELSFSKQRGGEVLHIGGLPYQHAVARLTSHEDGDVLSTTYTKLLSRLHTVPDEPHNMLLSSTWMMVIPRNIAWIEEIAANAASMVGMVWCNSEAQYEGWIQRGITNVLSEMGIPWKENERER